MEENKPFEIKPELAKAIAEFKEKQRQKSFSGRHPELGRMVKCGICSRRHRTSEICLQAFARTEDGSERVAPFHIRTTSKRIHPSKKRMQVVQLTRDLIPTFPNGVEDAKKARSKALNILRKLWHAASDRIQRQQKLSRRINWGLA